MAFNAVNNSFEDDRAMLLHLHEIYGGRWRLRDAMYDSRCYGCSGFIEKGDFYFFGGPGRSHHRSTGECAHFNTEESDADV